MTDNLPEQEVLTPESVSNKDDRAILHICYALLVGGFFSAGLTSLIALIIAYVKRHPEENFTFSHLTWIIRSVWIAFFGAVIGIICAITIILLPLAWLIGVIMVIWNVFRIAKGWLRLLDKRPVDEPHSLF